MKRNKKKNSGCLTLIGIMIILYFIGSSSGDKNNSNNNSVKHIYDNPQVIEVMNGTGNKSIGQMSLIEANSTDITEDVLNDWYFNYVAKNNFNWCVILYKDKPSLGVYGTGAIVSKDVILKPEKDGTYTVNTSVADVKNYAPKDSKLVEMK